MELSTLVFATSGTLLVFVICLTIFAKKVYK